MKKELFFGINGIVFFLALFMILYSNGLLDNSNSITGFVPKASDLGLDVNQHIVPINGMYDDIVLYCRRESPTNQEECGYLAKTFISISMLRNENKISSLGSAGLIPLNNELASEERYMDVFDFEKHTECCSSLGYGSGDCTIQPECNSDNDDRFDDEKSLEAGIRYFMGLYNKYYGNIHLIGLAFFTNIDVADRTLIDLSSRGNRELDGNRILEASETHLIRYQNELEDRGFEDIDIVSLTRQFLSDMENHYSFWSRKSIGSSPTFNEIVNNFGLYTINPSFSVNLDYNLNEYSNIMADSYQLIDACRGSSNIKQCIETNIAEYGGDNYEWHLGNCDEDREKFEQIIEDYHLCANSETTYSECYCDMQATSLPENTKIEMTPRTEFGRDVVDFTYYSRKDIESGYRVEDVYTVRNANICYFRERSWAANLIGLSDSFRMDEDKMTLLPDSDSIILDESGNRDLSDKLYKFDRNTICFIPEDAIDRDNVEILGKCNSQKKFYRFCVESNQKLFSKDKIEDSAVYMSKLQPVKYKFALYFRDDPPEPLRTIEVYDVPKDSSNVFVLFEKSDADDINYYNIYYQNLQELVNLRNAVSSDPLILENIKEMNLMPTADMKERTNAVDYISIRLDSVEELEKSPLDFNCIFDYDERKCRYNTMTNMYNVEQRLYDFQPDTLYFLEDKNKYLYVLSGLEKDTAYKFAVSAVDINGNELSNTGEESLLIRDYDETLVQDDLEFWRFDRSRGRLSWTGSVVYFSEIPDEFENGEETEEEPSSYSVFYYVAENGAEDCQESGVENIYLYESDLQIDDFPLNIERLPSMHFENYYCFGVLAERGEKRILGDESDLDSVRNLVTFSIQPKIAIG
jgi:hypothetical protein